MCTDGYCAAQVQCKRDERRCDLLTPEVCSDTGRWVSTDTPCTTNCVDGHCDDAPSCDQNPQCAEGVSCCEAMPVLGGTYSLQYVGRDGDARAVQRTVSSFVLDRFEVTYGRFLEFLRAYDSLEAPPAGAGAHPKIAGSGWREAWNSEIGQRSSDLEYQLSQCGDWRDASQLDRPVGCIHWYLALRFCIWDHGRLPTEAEWTYAAAGGSMSREYPWTTAEDQAVDAEHACFSTDEAWREQALPVGSLPKGRSWFGQDDMSGNLIEWVADSYAMQLNDASCRMGQNTATQVDCLAGDETGLRAQKGGSFLDLPENVSTFARIGSRPQRGMPEYGFRCARDPNKGTENEK
jgi:formylglycine-generating enzyme required for sulfatase activity